MCFDIILSRRLLVTASVNKVTRVLPPLPNLLLTSTLVCSMLFRITHHLRWVTGVQANHMYLLLTSNTSFFFRRPLPFGGSHLRLPSGPAGIRTTTGSLSALARPTPYQLSHRVALLTSNYDVGQCSPSAGCGGWQP